MIQHGQCLTCGRWVDRKQQDLPICPDCSGLVLEPPQVADGGVLVRDVLDRTYDLSDGARDDVKAALDILNSRLIAFRSGGKEQALDLVPVESLADNEEKCWWLSTAVLNEQDREAMNDEIANAATQRLAGADDTLILHSWQHESGYGAIYNVNDLAATGSNNANERRHAIGVAGYTERMWSLLCEACARGYDWLAFDRDISSEVK